MLDMDMNSGSDSDYTHNKLVDNDSDHNSECSIAMKQVRALPLHRCIRKCTPQQPGEVTGGAAGRLRRSATIVSRPDIARIIDMDMETDSDPYYTDDKLHLIDNDTDTDDDDPQV